MYKYAYFIYIYIYNMHYTLHQFTEQNSEHWIKPDFKCFYFVQRFYLILSQKILSTAKKKKITTFFRNKMNQVNDILTNHSVKTIPL